mgnify:CR=1 FL=1
MDKGIIMADRKYVVVLTEKQVSALLEASRCYIHDLSDQKDIHGIRLLENAEKELTQKARIVG